MFSLTGSSDGGWASTFIERARSAALTLLAPLYRVNGAPTEATSRTTSPGIAPTSMSIAAWERRLPRSCLPVRLARARAAALVLALGALAAGRAEEFARVDEPRLGAGLSAIVSAPR
jgi:hypothetical protein